MAAPAQIRRKATPAPDKKQVQRAAAKPEVNKAPKQEAVRVPAYAQAKLSVSHPQDAAEKEADKVARQVTEATKAEGAHEPKAPPATLEPGIHRAAKDKVATVPAAKNIQRKAASPEENKLSRAAKPEEPKAARQAGHSSDAMAGAPVPDHAEARIQANKGGGSPLPERVKTEMEGRLGQDFSAVRIHTDKEAVELCTEMQARAFTVGPDIFFASGEFAPETPAGKELLAHELTHVVQQDGGAARTLMRTHGSATAAAPAAGGANTYTVRSGHYNGTTLCTDPTNKTLSLPKIRLPHLKQRNSGLFPKPLPVRQGTRPNTDQTNKWRQRVGGTIQSKFTTLATNARTAGATATDPVSSAETFFFSLTSNSHLLLFGTQETLLPRLEIPIWDPQGHGCNFQVDHIREMQLNGDDVHTNYELLEGDANMGAGRAIANEIRDTIKGGLEALHTANAGATIPAPDRWSKVKNDYQVSYADIDWTLPHDGADQSDRAWSLDKITNGDHLALLHPLTAGERGGIGSTAYPALFASASGGESLPSVASPRINWIPRVDLVSWTPAPTGATGENLGTLVVSVFKPASNAARAGGIAASPEYPNQNWQVKRITGLNAGYVDPTAVSTSVRNSLRLPGMSPIEMGEVSLSGAGLVGEGRVIPTVPLIGDADIRIRVNGNDAQIYKTFSPDEIHLPRPLAMNSCELTVSYGTRNGLGIDGRAEFGLERVGTGFFGAAASMNGVFGLDGGFDFDSKLFDRAHIQMAYRENQLSGSGEIGIDNPNKIRGIRSANITASFQDGAFSATGTVQPNIPGVQQAGLTVSHSEAEGLVIGGNLQLAANPAIRSGSVDVTVRKQGDDWKVAASGTAVPAIPGINSQLTVSYDDGAFTAEASGDFRRGMLAGSARVGATNRTLGADGQPSGPAAPDSPVVVYGGGSATLQIAPWLQGTAGMRFAPNGEVTVSGDIGLPSSLQIFPRKDINRTLFSVSTQIPIVPGIVAEVGGNLSATAGIGPGALDQCHIGIEYNPSHEENTHVTGDVHLNVPADAGLRLAARAGIGLGITGASATGGLELGGGLGISGAAEAGVHIDWMPARGLQIDAEGYIHAEPKFKVDVSGYVAVTALGFSVYDNTWRLAEKEIGSNLRLGARFPIHYREGQPFDVSLNDVEFEVPQIDLGSLTQEISSELIR
jgi:hypothetical protein